MKETDINKLFFELIRVALGNQETLFRSPSKAQWAELYAMAKKQSLVGICFAGLQKLYNFDKQEPNINNPQPDSTHNQEPITKNLDKVQCLMWMGMAAKIQQRNEVINQRNVDLQHSLIAVGLECVTLKGQAVSTYYPEDIRLLRQAGDIDVWVLEERMKVIEYVNSVNPTNLINLKHIELKCYKDVEVELHFIPALLHCPWHNNRLQRFFSDNLQIAEVCLYKGGSIKMGSPVFNVVQLLAHSYHHLFGDGIGLRQAMDLYYATLALDNSHHDLTSMLKDCGLLKFAQSMMYVLSVVFNMPEERFICKSDIKNGKFILNEIMQAGNFGKFDERISRDVNEGHIHRFFRVTKQNIKLLRISSWEVFWTPLWRICHFFWMKKNGYVQ